MARFTSIGMPRKTFVASAAEETQAAGGTDADADAGHTPSTGGGAGGDDAEAPTPKKKVHRSGKRLKAKLQRQEAIARGEMEAPGPTPPTEGSKSSVAKMEKKRKAEEEARGGGGGGWGNDTRRGGGAAAGGVQRDGYAMRKMGGAGAESGYGSGWGAGAGAGAGQGWGRDAAIAKKTKFSEDRADARREQRIQDKTATTICYACRGQGHSARECPNASAPGADAGSSSNSSSAAGGMCYRCGSKTHTLAHCARPANPDDPTPHATCYVCSAQGHLSSQCPQNAKGVYVHGGKCNLCGSVRHRIGDCPERGKRDAEGDDAERLRPLGAGTVGASRPGGGGAADEDDFMEQSRERIQSGALDGTAKKSKKGKMDKKEFNNNGLRRPYKADESERVSGSGSGAAGAQGEGEGDGEQPAVKAKKAKVVAF